MKKIKAISAGLLFSTIFIVSCGPSQVVVRERPAEPVYVRPVSPGPGYVWIGGNWVRSGKNYTYRQGSWVAPRTGRVYHEGYWAQNRKGYYYRKGGWR